MPAMISTTKPPAVSARPTAGAHRSVVVTASSHKQQPTFVQQAATAALSTLLGVTLALGTPQVASANPFTGTAPVIGEPPASTGIGRTAEGIKAKWLGRSNAPSKSVSSLLGTSRVSNTAAPTNEGPTGKKSVQGVASKPAGIVSVKAVSKFGGGSADGAGAAQKIGAGTASNKGQVPGPESATGNLGRVTAVPDAGSSGFSESKLTGKA